MRFLSIVLFLFIANCSKQVEEPGKENNITRKSHLAPFPESIGRKLNRKIFETLSKANIDSQFVRIAPGVFEMGSPKDEIGRDKDEYRHKVEITEPYFMAKFETTIEEWNSVNNVIKRWGKLNIPINIRTIISVIIEHGQKSFLKKLPKFLNQRLRSMAANKDIDCLADFGAVSSLFQSWKKAPLEFKDKVATEFGKKTNVKIDHEYITKELNDLLSRHRNLPINNISYTQAVAYCHAKTQMAQKAEMLPTGMVYRLPTEAEWEYACRAGMVGSSGLGNGLELNGLNANLDGSEPGFVIGKVSTFINRKKLIPVSQKYTQFPPNQWGLYDMHGSVMEWCYDFYGEYLDKKFDPSIDKRVNPMGTFMGTKRVLRGGSFLRTAYDCRAANRECVDPSWRGSEIGFRIVLGFPIR